MYKDIIKYFNETIFLIFNISRAIRAYHNVWHWYSVTLTTRDIIICSRLYALVYLQCIYLMYYMYV